MASLEKSLRSQLERTVKDARDVAEAGARAVLEQMGVGDATPPDHLLEGERDLRRRLRIHGRQLGDEPGEKKGTQTIERLVEEVAYEHWHRLLFASFLAENQLLMYPDPDEPVAISLSECDDMAADEGARNGWELAARYASQMLPQIFRIESPIFELQLPPEHQQELEKFVADLPTNMYTASDSLGWVYQFWQARRKDEVNTSGDKIGERELPVVTQLFTEDYMVDFLLDNTLGAWHAGKVFAKNANISESASDEQQLRNAVALPGCSWDYLRFTQSESGRWSPAAEAYEDWPPSAKELKCLDPCMGSGHFIVAMFERLVALQMAEEQIDETTAVSDVISTNLFGLEIDPRCTQIAAFNLALAAWRRVGYRVLPPMNLACSGLAPNVSEAEWVSLANGDQKLEHGMERLYLLFEKAPILGSLINPRLGGGDLLTSAFHDLQPLIEKAVASEEPDTKAHEMAVVARGLAKAAEILTNEFTLVATNVPYLGFGRQDQSLQDFGTKFYPDSKADLATCFLERCIDACSSVGVIACVTPQNWLFLNDYKAVRKKLLQQYKWCFALRLGAGAFETISGEVVKATLVSISKCRPIKGSEFFATDLSYANGVREKKSEIASIQLNRLLQAEQLKNPNWVVTAEALTHGTLLEKFATAYEGAKTVDIERFRHFYWELAIISEHQWWFHNSSPTGDDLISGCHYVSANRSDGSEFQKNIEVYEQDGKKVVAWLCGSPCWKKMGVAVAWMNKLPASLYIGTVFDNSAAVILPKSIEDLPAVYCYVTSGDYTREVRKINQKVQVAAGTLDQVYFDLAHWQNVAAEEYPNGLPAPFSNDPRQWLFNGRPDQSDQPLQVAVARLLSYQWPRQTGSNFPDCPAIEADGLESHADQDGIVCIPPVRGEAGAADRLLNLLAAAYGSDWSGDVLGRLLADAGYAGKSLENWLRDGFFTQHLDIFKKRPFIWHVWDGLRDGFSALVNSHKLDRKNLETLIYTYLGNWIDRQTKGQVDGVDGAEEKLAAAEQLKKRLELILHGEAPYDIFVRWKPLHEQPIGWEPDINDGVRMNIRPFVSVSDVKGKGAGILRANPKIKWDKDRGKEPQRSKEDYPWFWGWDGKTVDFAGGSEFKGERFTDCHYTLAVKRAARESTK